MLSVIAGGNIAVTRVPVPGQRERKERRNVHSGPTSLNRTTINELLLTLPAYRADSSIFILAPGQEVTGSKRSTISKWRFRIYIYNNKLLDVKR